MSISYLDPTLNKKNDCYGCKERHVGCHGNCQKYQTYVLENSKEKAWLREKGDIKRPITAAQYRLKKAAHNDKYDRWRGHWRGAE